MAAGFALREDDARRLWLVRAVEASDSGEQLLTHEDRAEAEAYARGEVSGTGKRSQAPFLAARSRFASERLESRHPAIARALAHSRFPRWLQLVPGLAFFAGMISNELDGGNRLELLAFPLLGVIAWNIAVYLYLALKPLFGGAVGELSGPRWWQKLGNPLSMMTPDGASGLTTQVLGNFTADWARAARKLYAMRLGTVLHFAAALFALGLVAGIFLRALTVEYSAGWESTFLGPNEVRALLDTVLGPAAALTGIPLPDTAGITDLRWTGADAGGGNRGGENAGPWIILWTATVTSLVVVPRLMLAGLGAASAGMMARRVKVPGRDDFTVRRMLRAMGGESAGAGVRVTPYAYTPGETVHAALQAMMREALGDGTRLTIDPPCVYGAEKDWLERNPPDAEADLHLVLFSLSATPEQENHGTFLSLLREFYSLANQGVRVAALVDEHPYRAHFAGQAGLDDRIARRLEAWEAVMAKVPAPMVALALDGDTTRARAQALEAVLLGPAKRK